MQANTIAYLYKQLLRNDYFGGLRTRASFFIWSLMKHLYILLTLLVATSTVASTGTLTVANLQQSKYVNVQSPLTAIQLKKETGRHVIAGILSNVAITATTYCITSYLGIGWGSPQLEDLKTPAIVALATAIPAILIHLISPAPQLNVHFNHSDKEAKEQALATIAQWKEENNWNDPAIFTTSKAQIATTNTTIETDIVK